MRFFYANTAPEMNPMSDYLNYFYIYPNYFYKFVS